jgi:hypothetical protein
VLPLLLCQRSVDYIYVALYFWALCSVPLVSCICLFFCQLPTVLITVALQ